MTIETGFRNYSSMPGYPKLSVHRFYRICIGLFQPLLFIVKLLQNFRVDGDGLEGQVGREPLEPRVDLLPVDFTADLTNDATGFDRSSEI
jgi:hypothetical protein